MQHRDVIEGRVRELVEELAPVPAASILPSSRLVEDLSLDSVTILELIVTLEDDFDLPPIGPSEAFSVATLAQLQKHIADRATKRE